MSLENIGTNMTACQGESLNKKKIIQLGKLMTFLGAGILAGICIALILNG